MGRIVDDLAKMTTDESTSLLMCTPHCRMVQLTSLTRSMLKTTVMWVPRQLLSSTLKQHTRCKHGARLLLMRLKGRWPMLIHPDGP